MSSHVDRSPTKTVRQSVIVRAGAGPLARSSSGASVAAPTTAAKASRNAAAARARKQSTSKDAKKQAVNIGPQPPWPSVPPANGSRENASWSNMPELVTPVSACPPQPSFGWPFAGQRGYIDRTLSADSAVNSQQPYAQPYGFPPFQSNHDDDRDEMAPDQNFCNLSSRQNLNQTLFVLAGSRPDFATMHLNTSEPYPVPPGPTAPRRSDPPSWYTSDLYDASAAAYQSSIHYGPHPAGTGGDPSCPTGPLSPQGLQGTPTPLAGYHQAPPNCYASYGHPLPGPVASLPLDQADSDGDIALHIAVAKEDEVAIFHLIQMMLSARVSLDICNKLQQTALHLAVITANVSIIDRLLMAGACPTLPDRHGNNAVHLAVRSSSLEALKLLLDYPMSHKALRRYNYGGFTPLHLAVFRRDLDILSLLVAKGADCNCLDGTSGRTPLFHAVLNGQDDVVARLICLGASVNMANFAGITPLVVATDRRLKNITSLLISKGATVNSREET